MRDEGMESSGSGWAPRFLRPARAAAHPVLRLRSLPPRDHARLRTQAGWGPRDRWLLGTRGQSGPRKHPEVTNAVSSSLFGHFPLLRINLLLSHRPKSQQRRPGAGSLAHPAASLAEPLPLRNPFLGNPNTQTPARRPGCRARARKKTSVLPGARRDPPETVACKRPRHPPPPSGFGPRAPDFSTDAPVARKGTHRVQSTPGAQIFRNFARCGGGAGSPGSKEGKSFQLTQVESSRGPLIPPPRRGANINVETRLGRERVHSVSDYFSSRVWKLNSETFF